LGLQLLQVELRHATPVLERLVPHMVDERIAGRILDLLAPAWVDLCAARWLADCALRVGEKPVAVVNASSRFAAEMYVRKASAKPPRTAGPLVSLGQVYGETPLEEMVSEIKRALIQEFRLETDPFEDDLDQRLEDLLTLRDDLGKPVFVVMRFDASAWKRLYQLQLALPRITFLVLSGDDFPETVEPTESAVCLIEPKLQPGDELDAKTDWNFARSVIGN
jgi:hypothetical protein